MEALPLHIQSMLRFFAITLIRTVDIETKLAWKVLIFMRCKTYFHLYKNYRTIHHNFSDSQAKHKRNKIMKSEWRSEQRAS